MKYPFIFYVDTLPQNVGGCANGPVVRILKKYKDDLGIIRHEMEHVTQWAIFALVGVTSAVVVYESCGDVALSACIALTGVSVHSMLYKFFAPYRLHCEVEAYRAQSLCYKDDRRTLFSTFIAKHYNLNITPHDAGQLLRE